MTECPDPSVLRRHLSQELDPDEANRVRAHVAQCDACAARLGRIEDERTLTDPHAGLTEGLRLPPGQRIDGYVILEFIAAGGFGEVYLARQETPIRLERVALKVMRPGLDGRQVLARFEDERQKLALMDHENIARIHDAGTTPDGRPYFVMEYVAGVPITEHCDRLRLPIAERLELFCKVCEAIQHSHQKSIVHRDIKPSNVLVGFVNGKATPKVIDFGVAKALAHRTSDDLLLTSDDARVGTLPYMAPEQADPTPQGVDTRIDIYALGVLLYELLTGVLPFDPGELRRAGELEMIRHIRDVEPLRPSKRLSTFSSRGDTTPAERRHVESVRALELQVRDDLDWVTLKCLEKDRERRYASAQALADDIRRFLTGHPVSVGPPSLRYRARKFVRRNRGPVAAAVAIALVVAGGLAAATALWIERAENERLLAEAERDEARTLLEQARTVSHHRKGEASALVEAALERDPDLIAAKLFRAHLMLLRGEPDDAVAAAERAYEQHPESRDLAGLLSGLLRERDPARAARLAEAASGLRSDRASYFLSLGTEDDLRAIELLKKSLADNPWYRDAKYALASRRVDALQHEQALDDALLLTRVDRELIRPWILQGVALTRLGRHDEAIDSFTEAIATEPESWVGYYSRAWGHHKRGDYAAALDDLERARERDLPVEDAALVHALEGAAQLKRAEQLELTGQDQGEDWNAALASLTKSIDLDDSDPLVLRDRGDVWIQLRQFDAAIEDLTAALALDWAEPGRKAFALERRASALISERRLEDARRDLDAALAIHPEIAEAHFNKGRVLFLEQRFAASLPHFEHAVELGGAGWAMGRGVARWLLDDLDGALTDLSPYAEDDPWIRLWLWEIHTMRGDAAAAQAALDAAASAAQAALDDAAEAARATLDDASGAARAGLDDASGAAVGAAGDTAAGDTEADAEQPPDLATLRDVVEALRGERDENGESEMRTIVDGAPSAEARLYALYTFGADARLSGRTGEAARWFEEAVAVGLVNDVTHELAEVRLRQLAP